MQEISAQNKDVFKETSTLEFMEDVVKASMETVVLVDFWSPTCGPCKELLPRLKSHVEAAGGNVKLVTLNIADHPEIPTQMGVRSVPAVFAFKNGQPIDGFMGAQPDSEIKAFIKRVSGNTAEDDILEQYLDMAKAALDAGTPQEAAAIYSQLLTNHPEETKAIAGLVDCYIQVGELETAEQTLSSAEVMFEKDPFLAKARTSLNLAKKSKDSPQLKDIEIKLKNSPDDPSLLFDYAMALNGAGKKLNAAEQLVKIIKKDSDWQDKKAHKQLLEFFEAWGGEDPATIKGRQILSSVLF